MPKTKTHTPTGKTSEMVEKLAAAGCNHETIAGIVKITVADLEICYKVELEEGLERANGRIAAALYDKAMSGGRDAFAAQRFWLISKAGWKAEKSSVELMGKDGEPIRSDTNVSLDDKTLATIRRKFIGPDED